MEFIDLKSQQNRIAEQIKTNINTVLEHGQYIMGFEVLALEEKLAKFTGAQHAIGVASGTDALLVAMMALGVKAGDEVITTPFSFIATAEIIVLLGAKPVFVDINPETYNLDPRLLENAITAKTKAIMPVSLYGQCANFEAINAIANKYDLAVIEDACQSFGATYKGKKSCALTTIGCTSFFPSKPLGGYGDGGACFTNDDELAKAMREIRVHGQDRRYHHPRIGVNGRLDTLQAAILLAKLEIFDDEVYARGVIGAKYTALLKNHLVTPYIASDCTSVYAQYTVRVPNRDVVQAFLKKSGVPTAVHYPIPLHKQLALACCDHHENTELASAEVMSLPMHPYLTTRDQNHVVDSLLRALKC